MRLKETMLLAILFAVAAFSAEAAHTRAGLLLSATTARAGDTVMAGIQLQMDERWHTYWKNSGDSGMPTTIDWQLPPGVTAGEIRWPAPEKLNEKDFTTYIYQGQVILLVPLKLGPGLAPGPLEIKAKVDWLECDVQCIPGKANVEAGLNVGSEIVPSKDAGRLTNALAKLPQNGSALHAQAAWASAPTGDARPLDIGWNSPTAAREPDFFPDASSDFEVAGPTERLPADTGKVLVRKQVKKSVADWPKNISGLIIQTSGTNQEAYEVSLSIGTGTIAAGLSPAMPAASSPVALPALWKMLIYAFIGGLILNAMPCVLPVIALKILAFVGQAHENPQRARALGLIYALGVLVSFLALALLVIGIKAAGHKAGWGIQFGNA